MPKECHDHVISQFAFELRIKAKEEEVGKSFHDPFKFGLFEFFLRFDEKKKSGP